MHEIIKYHSNFKGYKGGVNGLTCGGDSGSPLVVFDSKTTRYTQVGIVSRGSCQSFTNPAIFARIEDTKIFEFIMKQFLAQNEKSLPKPRPDCSWSHWSRKINHFQFLIGMLPREQLLVKNFLNMCRRPFMYQGSCLWNRFVKKEINFSSLN